MFSTFPSANKTKTPEEKKFSAQQFFLDAQLLITRLIKTELVHLLDLTAFCKLSENYFLSEAKDPRSGNSSLIFKLKQRLFSPKQIANIFFSLKENSNPEFEDDQRKRYR